MARFAYLEASPDVDGLVDTLRSRVDETGDPALAAMLAIAEGGDNIEEATALLPLNETTWPLVARSKTRYSEAADPAEARETG